MKLSFSIKNKEVSLDADVERLVEKQLEHKASSPSRKTRYQIKQEEKRKSEELKHKHQLQSLYILLGLLAFLIVVAMVAAILKI